MTTAQRAVWDAIQRLGRLNRCRCELRGGMSQAELSTLGGGCTMPTFCCPTLDAYRRRTPQAAMPAEAAPKPATSARAASSPPPRELTATAAPEPARYDPFASQVVRG